MSCREPPEGLEMGIEKGCDLHLHAEVELLRRNLAEKQHQLMDMETQCLRESDRQAELEDSLVAWQDKYDRLYESHKRVQKVNQNLEDKLLKLADRNTTERGQWTSDVAKLSVGLADANYLISNLRREIDRYKTDMNLAIQLLQCNPENYSAPKISSLSKDMQTQLMAIAKLDSDSESLAGGLATDRRPGNFLTPAVSSSTVNNGNNQDSHSNVMYRVLPASESPPPPGVCPFPPTAMVYSMRGVDAKIDEITPSLMAKYLEQEILAGDKLAASTLKSGLHCSTCQCTEEEKLVVGGTISTAGSTFHQKSYTIGTQTVLRGDTNNSLCLRCNSNLNSPSRSSPFIMRLGNKEPADAKGTLSTATSASNWDEGGEGAGVSGISRKEELQVNPILGHHRLCDRNANGQVSVNATKSSQPPTGQPLTQQQQQVLRAGTRKIDSGGGVSAAARENGKVVGARTVTESESSAGTFSNVLIKNIKMSEHMSKSMNRPRLCSIRITSEGATTTNILLENAGMERLNCDTISIVSQEQSQQPQQQQLRHPQQDTSFVAIEQQVYKKRSKYLDEELDDTKEVIVCSEKNVPPTSAPVIQTANDSPGKVSQALIELNNRTDSEKFRETQQQSKLSKDGENEIGGGAGGGGGDQSAFLMDDPVPVVDNLRVMGMTTNHNNGSNDSVKDANLLRQEQLNRVAVWVQQSNEQQQQHLLSSATVATGTSDRHRKCTHSILSDSNASQLVAATTTTTPVSYSAEDVCIDIEEAEGVGNSSTAVAAAVDSDIAQMEYNVKQFLLKQNEWSIGRMAAAAAAANPQSSASPVQGHLESIGNIYSPLSSMSFTSLASNNNNQINLRTETNL